MATESQRQSTVESTILPSWYRHLASPLTRHGQQQLAHFTAVTTHWLRPVLYATAGARSDHRRACGPAALVNNFFDSRRINIRRKSIISSVSTMFRAPFDSENLRMHSRPHSRAPSWARTRPSFPSEYVLPRDRGVREDGDGDLILERARNNAPELDRQSKVISLQIGLRHLRDAYVEAKNQCQGALDGFDTATQKVASFAGPKAICQLWQDYLRHRHSTRVRMDAALDGVNYCLLNLGQQRNRITLPKPFGKHLCRIVKRGQHIIRDSAEAKTEHRAANRLVVTITAAAADVDPDSEANYRLLHAVDPSLVRQNHDDPKTNKSPEDENTDANDGSPV